MFCFQCQETAKNTGCTIKGVCGKPEETANLQDLLIFVLKGISVYGEKLKELGDADRSNDEFIAQGPKLCLGQEPLKIAACYSARWVRCYF